VVSKLFGRVPLCLLAFLQLGGAADEQSSEMASQCSNAIKTYVETIDRDLSQDNFGRLSRFLQENRPNCPVGAGQASEIARTSRHFVEASRNGRYFVFTFRRKKQGKSVSCGFGIDTETGKVEYPYLTQDNSL
jgi:hypothetical protein